ncbi:hypothetical protein [Paenibacillus montanisoli]|uniref:hypothetical protein n=1 Tax=Paenibacillus montanisoli TaxID=2081970 RepID=UPI001402ABEE|nr:hypothetical protein [Paenibacillus montanisoli]
MDDSIKFTGLPNPCGVGEYGVKENAKKLLRFLYFHQQLMLIGCGQLPARADWELKQGIGRHAYEDGMAASALRIRITELRTPAHSLGKLSDPLMELFFDELIHVRSDLEFSVLIYGFVKPELLRIYRDYIRKTQQIVDHPTVRMLRPIIWDLEEQTAWGERMIAHLKAKESLDPDQEQYIDYLKDIVQTAGGFDANGDKSFVFPDRRRSHTPYVLPAKSIRDSSMGPSVSYRTGMGIPFDNPDQEALADMMRIRQEEMGAAETIAGVIYSQKGMDWEFYTDLARHLWDEIRHTMLGQAALEAEGYNWRSRPQFVSDYNFVFPKVPAVRYAWLSLGVEEKAMKRPGKVGEYEFCRDVVKHPLMTLFQDYDWADEVVHAQLGRKWTPAMFDENLETIRGIALPLAAEKLDYQQQLKNSRDTNPK